MASERTPPPTSGSDAPTLPGDGTVPAVLSGLAGAATQVTRLHVQTEPGLPQTGTHLGETWGDFRFERLLGKGGMGAVYLGRQLSLDRPVAIKVLPPHLSDNEHFRSRFQLEARAVAKVSSPHVVQVYAAGTHGGHHYFAMEYVEGADLADRLRDGFRPAPREAIELMIQAARGLAAAGAQGVVHRDIKPGNMMIGGDGVLKLMDFGLAKLASEGQHLTMTGTVMGTVSYFSPEQGRGQPTDQRTDLYAMGVVLYELLCRRLPFTGPDATSVIYQHIHTEPAPPRQVDPGIGTDLERVVLTCLRKRVEDRYQTAQELLEDLESVLAGRPPAHARNRAVSGDPARPRGRLVPVLAGAAVLAAAAAGAWVLLAVPPADPPAAPPVAPVVPAQAAPAMPAPRPAEPVAVAPLPPPAATAPAADPSAPVRAALAAGEWDRAEALIAAQRATNAPGPWDDLDRDRRRGQAAALVVTARLSVERGEAEAADTDLSRARQLDPGANGLDAVATLLAQLRERRAALATAVAEIDGLIQRGELDGAERAAARSAARFGADPQLDAAAQRVKDLIRAREEGLARARAEQAARLLAAGQAAIAERDWTAAERDLGEAAALQPGQTDIAAALRAAGAGRQSERDLAAAVAAAAAARDLAGAEARLAELTAHAPRSVLIPAAQAAVQAEQARRAEEARVAAALEARLAGEARALAARLADPAQPLAEVAAAVRSWTAGDGRGRTDAAALTVELAARERREAASGVLAALDRAVVAGDRPALDTLIADPALTQALAGLSTQPGLVFVSRLISAEPVPGEPGAIAAGVVVRHALAVFPERDLRYRMRLAPGPAGFRILSAVLEP
jgi:predicted Ser/Thr protein kinase